MSTYRGTGRWHLRIEIPGGPVVIADYREPITATISRAAGALMEGETPEPSDVATIMSWYQANEPMVGRCREGTCEHNNVV
jgi:hypothetical protein